MKKRIRLTESDLHRIVKETVKSIVCEGTAFNPKPNGFGNDYFKECQLLADGIYKYLNAMEDEANANDYSATTYLYRQIEDRVNQLQKILPILKTYISEPNWEFKDR